MRLAQAGHATALVPLAQVHHGYAASVTRRGDRVPRDLFESARIDGADHFTIFWRLVLPLSVPVLAAFAIFSAAPVESHDRAIVLGQSYGSQRRIYDRRGHYA